MKKILRELVGICFITISLVCYVSFLHGQNIELRELVRVYKTETHILYEELKLVRTKLDSISIVESDRDELIKSRQLMFDIPQSFIDDGHFDLLIKSTSKYNVSLDLVLAQMKQESGFSQLAISYVGAKGYLQIMDYTALDIADHLDYDEFNIFDARTNIEFGVYYLSKQIRRFKSLDKALAAYNAGPSRVHRANGVPNIRETKDYVKRILEDYELSKI